MYLVALNIITELTESRGLIYFGTTKFENDANRPFCFKQLQAVIYPKSKFLSTHIVKYLKIADSHMK